MSRADFNQQSYSNLLRQVLGSGKQTGFFQHDNASWHGGKEVFEILRRNFDERVIGPSDNCEPILWPVNAGLLSPVDLLLKEKIRDSLKLEKFSIRDSKDVRNVVYSVLDAIEQDEVVNVLKSFRKMLNKI